MHRCLRIANKAQSEVKASQPTETQRIRVSVRVQPLSSHDEIKCCPSDNQLIPAPTADGGDEKTA